MRYSSVVAAMAVAAAGGVSLVESATVTFHLIAPSPTSATATVSIGDKSVPMSKPTADLPHFTAVADVPAGATYKYAVSGTAENFTRTVPDGRTDTYNDVFGRAITVQKLPPFPWPLEDEGYTTAQWQRAGDPNPLFDDSYIPTLYWAGAAKIQSQVAGGSNVTATLYVILKDQIVALPSTRWMPYKADTWKFGSLIYLEGGGSEKFNGRSWFKLRTGEFDPTNLREKTYTDMMVALGAPVAQQVHVRMYANGAPLGLFVLTDLVTNLASNAPAPDALYNHAFHVFESGMPTRLSNTGIPLICGTGATFAYKGEDPNVYNACYGPAMWQAGPAIVDLVKKVQAITATAPDSALQALEGIFDVDTFLRQMVMEYLTVNWDGYWDQSSNYIIYWDQYDNKKWYFTDNDFDQTFGSANSPLDGPEKPYTTYPSRTADQGRPLIGEGRPLIDNLLKNPKYKARFEQILTKTVKHMFNPVAFNRRIDAFANILRPEVNWDHSFAPDDDRLFVASDFDKGMDAPVTYRGKTDQGVGNGIKTWVALRARAVATQFNFEWDTEAKDPPVNVKPNITSVVNETTTGKKDTAKDGSGAGSSGNSLDVSFVVSVVAYAAMTYVGMTLL